MIGGTFLNKLIAVGTGIGLLFGAWFFVDDRFALRAELRLAESNIAMVEHRLDQKLIEDRLRALQDRLWTIQERFGEDCGNASNECREIRREIETLRREMEQD